MPTFVKSSLFEAPVESVFAFHERDDALALLSPAFPPVTVVSRTGGIREGSGPFARWVHRHEFSDENGRGRLTDRVTFELPGGRLVNALCGWAVLFALGRMFDHRHAVTRSSVA